MNRLDCISVSFVIMALTILIGRCGQNYKCADIRQKTEAYYKTYGEREDFDYFLSFYADSVTLEDIATGYVVKGKPALKSFFDWRNPDFELLDSVSLIINDQKIVGCEVSSKGLFTPFVWKGDTIAAMGFTSTLLFNESGKIVYHRDSINYPDILLQ